MYPIAGFGGAGEEERPSLNCTLVRSGRSNDSFVDRNSALTRDDTLLQSLIALALVQLSSFALAAVL